MKAQGFALPVKSPEILRVTSTYHTQNAQLGFFSFTTKLHRMGGCHFSLGIRKNVPGTEYLERETRRGEWFILSSFSFGMSEGHHFSRTNGYEYISK